MAPFSQRTSSGIPGFIPDSRRMSFGITNRPAWSMVVFMVMKIPFPLPSANGEKHCGLPAAQFCRIFAPLKSSSPDAFARTLVPLIVISPFFRRMIDA